MNSFSADPDFSQQVIDDLYRYRHKFNAVAFPLAIFLGIFGIHRFYLNRPLSGALMLLTAGGALVWWIYDIVHIKKMTESRNIAEKNRCENGEPPAALAFLPCKKALKIDEPPAWVSIRSSKARVYGSLFLLTLVGFVLGAVTGSSGTLEPSIILAIFIVASLTAARWNFLADVPILSGLAKWVHRLRLYYYSVDPGNIWLLGLRPIIGVFFVPFLKKTRAEVGLYLELSIFFSILFFIFDIQEILKYDSLWLGISLNLAEFLQTLIYTFLFVAPIGALLTTQILLSRKDWVIWLLSAMCLLGVFLGLLVVGTF
jgi:hypothetical protein